MATKSNYGQTWWGAQWLNALTQIDYDNRLPRGRNYANKGAVRTLKSKAIIFMPKSKAPGRSRISSK